MESKNITGLLTGILLTIIISGTVQAQVLDTKRFTSSVSASLLPIRISGIIEKPGTPHEFYKMDTVGLAAFITGQFGFILPVHANENWSTGIKGNVGFGIFGNLKAVEGLQSYCFDFPQFIYYRNYATKLDYEISVGYKYTRGALPFHLILGAADFYISEETSIGFYGSLNKYTYYMYFTDGRIEPMVQFREFGIKITGHF